MTQMLFTVGILTIAAASTGYAQAQSQGGDPVVYGVATGPAAISWSLRNTTKNATASMSLGSKGTYPH
jgi:hypothetical protein